MKTAAITLYSSSINDFVISEFEEAYYNSKKLYSINQLTITGSFSEEQVIEALKKALLLCKLAGININQHFKRVYVYDEKNETMFVDYRMSKRAFNLLMMQSPSLNENRAKWLWELADF